MPKTPSEFVLRFGALAPAIVLQLAALGYRAEKADARRWQKKADAITLLSVHNLIKVGEARRARQRLVDQIAATIERHNAERAQL